MPLPETSLHYSPYELAGLPLKVLLRAGVVYSPDDPTRGFEGPEGDDLEEEPEDDLDRQAPTETFLTPPAREEPPSALVPPEAPEPQPSLSAPPAPNSQGTSFPQLITGGTDRTGEEPPEINPPGPPAEEGHPDERPGRPEHEKDLSDAPGPAEPPRPSPPAQPPETTGNEDDREEGEAGPPAPAASPVPPPSSPEASPGESPELDEWRVEMLSEQVLQEVAEGLRREGIHEARLEQAVVEFVDPDFERIPDPTPDEEIAATGKVISDYLLDQVAGRVEVIAEEATRPETSSTASQESPPPPADTFTETRQAAGETAIQEALEKDPAELDFKVQAGGPLFQPKKVTIEDEDGQPETKTIFRFREIVHALLEEAQDMKENLGLDADRAHGIIETSTGHRLYLDIDTTVTPGEDVRISLTDADDTPWAHRGFMFSMRAHIAPDEQAIEFGMRTSIDGEKHPDMGDARAPLVFGRTAIEYGEQVIGKEIKHIDETWTQDLSVLYAQYQNAREQGHDLWEAASRTLSGRAYARMGFKVSRVEVTGPSHERSVIVRFSKPDSDEKE